MKALDVTNIKVGDRLHLEPADSSGFPREIVVARIGRTRIHADEPNVYVDIETRWCEHYWSHAYISKKECQKIKRDEAKATALKIKICDFVENRELDDLRLIDFLLNNLWMFKLEKMKKHPVIVRHQTEGQDENQE